MNQQLTSIKNQLREGHCEVAIEALRHLLETEASTATAAQTAQLYYLLGNAYRKQGDWQGALNNYQEAVARDAHSPAASARDMVMDILNFYNKDMFNQ